jgi:hypothetical protein
MINGLTVSRRIEGASGYFRVSPGIFADPHELGFKQLVPSPWAMEVHAR